MFEAGFTYILSKSLMNTRTKIQVERLGFVFLCALNDSGIGSIVTEALPVGDEAR